MADNEEEKVNMDGSEGSPERPQFGGEVVAATQEEVPKATAQMAAIDAQIKELEDEIDILLQNSQDSGSDRSEGKQRKESSQISLPL